MVEIKQLEKIFDKLIALSVDSFSIKENHVVSIVGNNGAGKTTFLRLLVNLIKPSSGQILYYDSDFNLISEPQSVISAYLDETFLLDFLTVKEYFKFILSVNKFSTESLKDRLAEFKDFLPSDMVDSNQRILSLSTGNKNKVGVVGAFLSNKRIVILDEPFANLDPKAQYFLTSYFGRINKEKKKILILSSHNLENIEKFSSRIVVIEKGRISTDAVVTPSLVVEIKQMLHANGC